MSARPLALLSAALLAACSSAARKGPAAAAARVHSLTEEVEEALSGEERSKRRFAEVTSLYRKDLAPHLQNGLPSSCGEVCAASVLAALDEVCSYDPARADAALPDQMRSAYARLKDAGKSTARQAGKVLECLVKHRRYAEAADFAPAESLLFPPIPEGAAADPAPGTRRLIEPVPPAKVVALAPPRTGVLMLASPTCPACVTALEEIEEDPALAERLAPALLVVARPSGADRAEAFAQANAGRRFPLREAYAAEDWPEFEDWEAEPRFVFLKDGVPVARTSGWGIDGLTAFKDELSRLGPLPTR